MKTDARIKTVQDRENRITYDGPFADFQTFGETFNGQRYSQGETESLSEYQNFLYKRAMFGLKMYSQEEIKDMHWQKRKRIEKVHKRTQEELNWWKQEKLIALTNKVFAAFHNSSLAESIIDVYSEPDPEYICKIPFKDLEINKQDIIDRLLNKGLLPYNFHTLNES